ncbi:hypothetical protein [Segetibacter koreensis]|uniref:hypothetical protein n=1 Tax=Segetibacter koreensis TaxID=398037 RepID=UPI00036FAC14|nr:hypothetical protein [Segetibacter koreensis]
MAEVIIITRHTDETITKYLHPNTVGSKKDVYQHLHQMMVNTAKADAAASHLGRARRRNNLDYLKSISVHVMVLVGVADAFTTEEEMRNIA